MATAETIWTALAVVLVLYQLIVTARVLASSQYTWKQRLGQSRSFGLSLSSAPSFATASWPQTCEHHDRETLHSQRHQKILLARGNMAVEPSATSNNAFERSVRHRGRTGRAQTSVRGQCFRRQRWPAAQLDR
jgi:hypothetical protein